MPPKKPEPKTESVESQQANATGKRLLDKAVSRGILTQDRPVLASKQQPSRVLTTCNNRDIVKKGTLRKNRYLFALPAMVAPGAAGTLGSVEDMDTRNPVVYMHFPEGRMKFFGTILHPTNRYLTLSFPNSKKAPVQCEDCFDSIVVFSDWAWIGKKSFNPEERRLPLPPELRELRVHSSYSFTAGAAEDSDKAAKLSAAVTSSRMAVDNDSAADTSASEGEEELASQPLSQERPRSARAAAAKVKSYALDAAESDESGSENEERGRRGKGASVAKLPPAKPMSTHNTTPAAASVPSQLRAGLKATPKRKAVEVAEPLGDNGMPLAMPKSTPTAKGSVKPKQPNGSEDAVVISDDEDNEDSDASQDSLPLASRAKPSSAHKRGSRPDRSAKKKVAPAGRAPAKKKRKKASDSDEEVELVDNESDEDESENDDDSEFEP